MLKTIVRWLMMKNALENKSLEEILNLIEIKKQENSELRKDIIKKNKILKDLIIKSTSKIENSNN